MWIFACANLSLSCLGLVKPAVPSNPAAMFLPAIDHNSIGCFVAPIHRHWKLLLVQYQEIEETQQWNQVVMALGMERVAKYVEH